MFVRLCLNENPLYADEGPIDNPNPHSFFQIGMRGWRYSALHHGPDGVNLFVGNSRWSSFVAEDTDYAFRLQYIKSGRVIHERVDEEIAREKGYAYPFSAILSPTPTLD